MKRRITINQLNELNEKQKQNLRKWWKKNFKDGDIDQDGRILSNIHIRNNEQWIYFYTGLNNADSTPLDWNRILPLLDIGQMIEFIEEATQSKIDMSFLFDACDYHDGAVGYAFTFYRIYEGNIWGSGQYDVIEIREIDKLKAIWKLVCKIAEEQELEG